MIQAVLFDFDGVLTTDKTGSLTTCRFLSAAASLELARVQSAFRPFNGDLSSGKTSHAEVWPQICRALGQTLSFDLLVPAFDSTPMNARMLALARSLSPSYRVGIVTDNKKDRIDRLKQVHGLPALFDPIVVSAEVGSGKEAPEIFRVALHALKANAEECVFIDNSLANLVVPRALGLKTIHFDDATQDFEALLTALEECGVAARSGAPPKEPTP